MNSHVRERLATTLATDLDFRAALQQAPTIADAVAIANARGFPITVADLDKTAGSAQDGEIDGIAAPGTGACFYNSLFWV